MSGNTPIADVVDAPTIGAATAGLESATVAYTAATTGGTATSFTAISTPGSLTGTGASPITVSGLTGGTAYTFKVYGTNASGVWSGVQSAASNSVTPTSAAFESIATVTSSGGETSLSFTSIPGTYKSLQIRSLLRSNRSLNTVGGATIYFNSDTSSIYDNQVLTGDGTTASVNSSVGYPGLGGYGWLTIPFANTTANVFGASIIDIHNYASTTQNKTVRAFSGADTNDSNGKSGLFFGSWLSTSAITSITFDVSGNLFTAGSTFALYGVK
jgi:hypothetical protein